MGYNRNKTPPPATTASALARREKKTVRRWRSLVGLRIWNTMCKKPFLWFYYGGMKHKKGAGALTSFILEETREPHDI